VVGPNHDTRFNWQEEEDTSAYALTGDQWKVLYLISEYSSLSNDRVTTNFTEPVHSALQHAHGVK
jgi:hypothetical protein